MKHCKQRSKQIVIELMNYINMLKSQFFIQFFDYIRYFNLLKIFHLYLRNAIICRVNEMITRAKLKKLTRLFEKNE